METGKMLCVYLININIAYHINFMFKYYSAGFHVSYKSEIKIILLMTPYTNVFVVVRNNISGDHYTDGLDNHII